MVRGIKKNIGIVSVMVMIGMLTGCQSEKEQSEAQIALIADQMEMWAESMGYANDMYSYAVTDLDQNGRLEIIAVNMGGTGFYTYSTFYEVNETFDGLQECERDVMEGESQPDIAEPSMTVYYDDLTGIYYYMTGDYLKISAAEYEQFKIALSLVNGRICEEPIVYEEHIYTEDADTVAEEISYYDIYGNEQREITEEEYRNAEEQIYFDMEKKTVSVSWCDFPGADGIEELWNMSREEIYDMLSESYAGFGIS